MSTKAFAEELLALWHRAHGVSLPGEDFAAWSGATKDLLLALGLEWRGDDYTIVVKPKYEHDCKLCTFLGTLFNTPNGTCDLYACTGIPMVGLIARYSSDGGDYEAVTLFGDVKQLDDRYPLEHPLSVALRLYLDMKAST